MTADNYIIGRIATFCMEEFNGMGDWNDYSAIAHVLRNRVDAGWHGGDWMRVIEDAPRVRANTDPRRLTVGLKEFNVKSFMQVVDEIYRGSADDEFTNAALYYGELHNVSNEWFLQNIVRQPHAHPRIAQIGLTSFFG